MILSFLPGGWAQSNQVKEIVTNVNRSIIGSHVPRGIQVRQTVVKVLPKAAANAIGQAVVLNIGFSDGLQVYSDRTMNPCRSPREFATRAGVAGGFAIVHSGASLFGQEVGAGIGSTAGPVGTGVGAVVGGLVGSTTSILLLEEATFFNGRSLKGVVLYRVSPSEHIGQP